MGKDCYFFGLYIAEKMRDYPNPDPVFSVTRRIKSETGRLPPAFRKAEVLTAELRNAFCEKLTESQRSIFVECLIEGKSQTLQWVFYTSICFSIRMRSFISERSS